MNALRTAGSWLAAKISSATAPRIEPLRVQRGGVDANGQVIDDHDEEEEPLESVQVQIPANGPVVGVLRGAFEGNVARLIAQHGGRPVALDPQMGSPKQLMAQVDGLAICGGRDVDPRFYGEANTKSGGINPAGTQEDAFMLGCIQEGYNLGTPMLGMCRGHQLMNVADGGSLYQDFPSDLQLPARHGSDGHVVSIEPDSQIARLIGTTRWPTNTMHHQAVKEVGKHMVVTARTSDGIVEGIQRKDNPRQIGVQFHPEVMQDGNSHKLFEYLLRSAETYRSERHQVCAG